MGRLATARLLNPWSEVSVLRTDTLRVACRTSGAPGGALWGAWWQRGPSRAAGAFERLDAVLETYTDVTRFPRWGPDRRVLGFVRAQLVACCQQLTACTFARTSL